MIRVWRFAWFREKLDQKLLRYFNEPSCLEFFSQVFLQKNLSGVLGGETPDINHKLYICSAGVESPEKN